MRGRPSIARRLLSVMATAPLLAAVATAAGEDDGVARTAILSFPEFFCHWTEHSTPHAYIAFAFEIDGRLAFLHTDTSCEDFADLGPTARRAIFGERVTLYGGSSPTRVRRSDGSVYDLEPGRPIRSVFKRGAAGRPGTPAWADSPNPDLLEAECRKLVDDRERAACLRYVPAAPPPSFSPRAW